MGVLDDMMAGSARDTAHRERAAGRDSSGSEARASYWERRAIDADARERDRKNQQHLERQVERLLQAEEEAREERRREREEELERELEEQEEEEAEQQAEDDFNLLLRLIGEAAEDLQSIEAGHEVRGVNIGKPLRDPVARLNEVAIALYSAQSIQKQYQFKNRDVVRDLPEVVARCQEVCAQHQVPDLQRIATRIEALLRACARIDANTPDKLRDQISQPTSPEDLKEAHTKWRRAYDQYERELDELQDSIEQCVAEGVLTVDDEDAVHFSPYAAALVDAVEKESGRKGESRRALRTLTHANDASSRKTERAEQERQASAALELLIGSRGRLIEACEPLHFLAPAVEALRQAWPLRFKDETLQADPRFKVQKSLKKFARLNGWVWIIGAVLFWIAFASEHRMRAIVSVVIAVVVASSIVESRKQVAEQRLLAKARELAQKEQELLQDH